MRVPIKNAIRYKSMPMKSWSCSNIVAGRISRFTKDMFDLMVQQTIPCLFSHRFLSRNLETFTFDSRRHEDYPFALALYINGLFDSRISVCCEYKHKHNVRLGSRCGLFGIYDVRKSQPCRMYVCRGECFAKENFDFALGVDSNSIRRIFSQQTCQRTLQLRIENR